MNSRILGTRFREGAKILVVYENDHPSKHHNQQQKSTYPTTFRQAITVLTFNNKPDSTESCQEFKDQLKLGGSLESNCKASAACKPQATATNDISWTGWFMTGSLQWSILLPI